MKNEHVNIIHNFWDIFIIFCKFKLLEGRGGEAGEKRGDFSMIFRFQNVWYSEISYDFRLSRRVLLLLLLLLDGHIFF